MKIDMHCHVKEGSIDSRVGIEEYITILKEHGFQGMVITDHDTYNGYRYWKKNLKGKKHTDFVVLKGIEYDTRDAGHILVIMPEGVKMRLLEMRGMPLALLIDLVHRNGGVLGPAHPCGEKYMSFTHARRYYLSPEIVKRFDFIETFNCCEPKDSNAGALKLAEKYGKVMTGGSDSHMVSLYFRHAFPYEYKVDGDVTIAPSVKQAAADTITVSGKVLIAANVDGTESSTGVAGIDVIANGEVVATSAADGSFTATVPVGTTSLTVHRENVTIDRTVTLTGTADISNVEIPVCICDYNGDGVIDGLDKLTFYTAFSGGSNAYDLYCDYNKDNAIDGLDKLTFFTFYGKTVEYAALALD